MGPEGLKKVFFVFSKNIIRNRPTLVQIKFFAAVFAGAKLCSNYMKQVKYTVNKNALGFKTDYVS